MPTISLLAAFTAGIVSLLSPCVLPLVPGYVSYMVGRTPSEMQRQSGRTLGRSLLVSRFLVAGFSIVFIALGASASALGQLLSQYRYETNIVGVSVILLCGLLMSGVLRINLFARDLRFQTGRIGGGNPLSALVLGLAIGFGWTPCIGPVLGAILTVTALHTSASEGMLLLTVFSLGLGVPFVATALFTSQMMVRIKRLRRWGGPAQVVAGLLLVIMDVAMITGYLSQLGVWPLNRFPWLFDLG